MSSTNGRIFVGGKKLNFSPLTLNFRIDEDYENYTEIFNWMVGISGQTDFSNYKKLVEENSITPKVGHEIYSDGTLVLLNNSKNFNKNIVFYNMFPTDLSSPEFTFSDTTVATSSVTFQYDYFEMINEDS
jgi:hypothetical protein